MLVGAILPTYVHTVTTEVDTSFILPPLQAHIFKFAYRLKLMRVSSSKFRFSPTPYPASSSEDTTAGLREDECPERGPGGESGFYHRERRAALRRPRLLDGLALAEDDGGRGALRVEEEARREARRGPTRLNIIRFGARILATHLRSRTGEKQFSNHISGFRNCHTNRRHLDGVELSFRACPKTR